MITDAFACKSYRSKLDKVPTVLLVRASAILLCRPRSGQQRSDQNSAARNVVFACLTVKTEIEKEKHAPELTPTRHSVRVASAGRCSNDKMALPSPPLVSLVRRSPFCPLPSLRPIHHRFFLAVSPSRQTRTMLPTRRPENDQCPAKCRAETVRWIAV